MKRVATPLPVPAFLTCVWLWMGKGKISGRSQSREDPDGCSLSQLSPFLVRNSVEGAQHLPGHHSLLCLEFWVWMAKKNTPHFSNHHLKDLAELTSSFHFLPDFHAWFSVHLHALEALHNAEMRRRAFQWAGETCHGQNWELQICERPNYKFICSCL